MKSRFLLIIILGVFLLLPKGVFAQEYTFEIGNGKQWNESNIDQLSDLIYELQDQDMYDDKVDNKYIFNFVDGNYDYTDFSLCEFGFFEYNFGSGNYKIHSIIGEMLGSVICRGKGIEKTHLQLNSFSEEIIGYVELSNMTIDIDGSPFFGVFSEEELLYNNLTNMKVGLFFNDIVINNLTDSKCFIEISYSIEIPTYIDFDNVTFAGNNHDIYFEIGGDSFVQSKEKLINIKNCDLSSNNLSFIGYGDRYKILKAYLKNNQLNNIYAKNIDVDIDCNSTFKSGIVRGNGIQEDQDVFEDNQYTIYEYYEDDGSEKGNIITSVCKNKTINIKNKMSLSNIKKEFGYDIDDTWDFNPKGIVELRKGEIVPLKLGKVTVSKEIDGEVQYLIINVVDSSNKKDSNKSSIIVDNPKTGVNLILVMLLIISILAFTVSIFKKRYE